MRVLNGWRNPDPQTCVGKPASPGFGSAVRASMVPNDQRSPLFRAGNAGVIARGGRLWRRDDESRGESYADILKRAGLAHIEGRGMGAADPAAQSSYAMHAQQIDRSIPDYTGFVDEPMYRIVPRNSKHDVWGTVAIVPTSFEATSR
jgi:hypothetical protein